MKMTLDEETFGDAIKDYGTDFVKEVDAYEDKLGADAIFFDETHDENGRELTELEQALNRAYEVNIDLLDEAEETNYRRTPKAFSNVIVAGPAGIGKTSIVEDWADKKGVRLLTKSAMELDMGDLGGVVAIDIDDKYKGDNKYEAEKQKRKAKRYSLNEFDELGNFGTGEGTDYKYCVLFLDEFNRAAGAVRASLLTLINSHKISDSDVKGGKRFLPAFLFTVAAVNPTSYSDSIEPFDHAELGRARVIEMQYNPQITWNYFKDLWGEKIKRYKRKNDLRRLAQATGQLALAERILNHSSFHFAEPEDENASREEGPVGKGALSPRSLEMLLSTCNGTKDSFIKMFPEFCGSSQLPMIKSILSSYTDVDMNQITGAMGTGTSLDNKANSVFKQKSKTNTALDDWVRQNS